MGGADIDHLEITHQIHDNMTEGVTMIVRDEEDAREAGTFTIEI